MALSIGTRLGPYEILGAIGAGGMGEVYRAHDTKLNRDVAIKVLPDMVASDPDRLARFHREAQVLASLNHPNIAHIHGYEESNGVHALVMELVEGLTLAEMLAGSRLQASGSGSAALPEAQSPKPKARGLPLDDALKIGRQIAEALEAAHEQGVVHRDLKPANIKVREDGAVKVLDFGLAKLVDPAAPGANANPGVTASPTITTPAMMTGIGVILGTAAYMSPEQARGRPVDKRTDIWAFGCVLYEMLAGRRAFVAEDVSLTLAEIMKSAPDFAALPADTPTRVRHALRVCLQKNPRERGGDISAIRLLLDGVFEHIPSPGLATAAQPPAWRRVVPLMAGLAIGVLASGAAFSLRSTVAPGVVGRFEIDLAPGSRAPLAISPDGTRIAIVARDAVFIRERDNLELKRVYDHGSPGVSFPLFSRDGRAIVFYESGELKRLALSGGMPTTVAKVANVPSGMNWAADDTILFGQPQGIMRVPAAGGNPDIVVAARTGERVYGPDILPDGRTLLYAVTTTERWQDAQIVAQRPGNSERVVLATGGSAPRYLPSGYLLYEGQDQLFALGFDAATLRVRGRPTPVLQSLSVLNTSGSANYALSNDGTLVHQPQFTSLFTMVWVDRDGRETPVGAPDREYRSGATVSPDGGRVAVNVGAGAVQQVWVYSIRRSVLERLNVDETRIGGPQWSPDGKSIVVYSENSAGRPGVFRRAADGSGQTEQLATGHYYPLAWSHDGRQILFLDFGANVPGTPPPDADLGLLTLEPERSARPLMKTPAQEGNGDISPDGRWIVYYNNELGQNEVFARPFPNVDAHRWRISPAGGRDPKWARDGKALFYRSEKGVFMVATTGSNPDDWGKPVKLFERDFPAPGGASAYDVAPDGRFLTFRTAANQRTQPGVIVTLNWVEELKRLVPTN